MLRDECPEGNELLTDFEFTDEEIAYAIRNPIEQFNVTYVPITSYTTLTFPAEYRYYWKHCVLGHLLRQAVISYSRNDLQYNAGGVDVADKRKFQQYAAFADGYLKEWQAFMRQTKCRLNMESCIGSLGSAYRQPRRW
jgi:hypothetical protein